MIAFILRRVIQSVPTLLGIAFLTFVMVRLVPGDPVLLMLGERGGSPEVYRELQESLGLHLPYWQQFVIYIGNLLQGDLGQSVVSKQPVWQEFAARFPATLELGITGLIFAILLGVPLGVLAAVRRKTWVDTAVTTVSLAGYSMPVFWWGLILILFFSVGWGWTPVSGRMSVMYIVDPVTGFLLIDSLLSEDGWEAFTSAIHHLVLPALTLGTIPLAVIVRMTRSSMLEVLHQDFIRTAKAKGLKARSVVFGHALKNALIPIITVIGLMTGSVLTGAVLTETIYSWPGIGRWLVLSVQARDYPVIQGGVFCVAVVIISVNIFVDVVYTWVNPRMRDQMQKGAAG